MPSTSSTAQKGLTHSEYLTPCGPLIGKLRRVLIIGETSSLLPDDLGMEYSERSMWNVLSKIVEEARHKDEKDFSSYQRL